MTRILILFCLFLMACDGENKAVNATDSTIAADSTDSAKYTDSTTAEKSADSTKSIDSTESTANIFLDNAILRTNEPQITLLIFGMDNCGSCKMLKKTIEDSSEIRHLLKSGYLTHYINLSDDYIYTLQGVDSTLRLESSEIKAYFGIVATPTMVFVKNDTILLLIPGYMSQKRLVAALEMLLESKIDKKDKNLVAKNMESLLQRFKNQGI